MLFQTRHWSHALGRVWKGKICLENANKTPAPPSQNLSQHLLSYSSSSPSNKAQDPFPGKLPSNWLQLKATFWISESRRAQERVWICVCVCVCVVREHPVGGTLVTADRVFSPAISVSSSSHADVRLLSVCRETSTGQKRFLSICTSMFFDTQRIHLDAGSPSDLHSFTKLCLTRSHIHPSMQTAMKLYKMSLAKSK